MCKSIVLLALALLLGLTGPAAAQILELPVEFSVSNTNTSRVACASDQAPYLVQGHLVGPASVLGGSEANAVTLYLHPLDAGEWFWRFKAVPGFDYAAEMAALGHVSLVVDRIGYDSSGHPVGFLSCVGSQADVAHQLVQGLRDGLYSVEGGSPIRFSNVAIGGLSIGGLLSQVETYSYQDVDALMVMGWSDQGTTQEAQLALAEAEAICAAGGQDAEEGGPPGYVFFFQNEADFKAGVFYSAPESVRDAAAALRNRNPCGDVSTIVQAIQVDRTGLGEITVPVLLLYGEQDAAFQGGAAQAAHFTGSPDVTTVFFEETGHFMTLEASAGEFRETVSDWLIALPEPDSWLQLAGGGALVAALYRRRPRASRARGR